MRLLADLNIAPRSATFLRSLGHDLIRVNEVLPSSTPDEQIVEFARAHGYTVLTQDLDFSVPTLEADVLAGAIITVEEYAVRARTLPIS